MKLSRLVSNFIIWKSFKIQKGLMGACSSRMRLNCKSKKEIISRKSLEVIMVIVTGLRSNAPLLGNAWLFRPHAPGINTDVAKEIYDYIYKGDVGRTRYMLDSGWNLEAAQALFVYLMTSLDEPLIPHSIQSLVLDDNSNVPVEVVAADVLGLMREELTERHLQLSSALLNLLNSILKGSTSDELRGHTLLLTLLPVFFNIQSGHISEWRKIATIFVEIIRQSESGDQLEMGTTYTAIDQSNRFSNNLIV